jgi:TolB-like protein
VSEDQPSVTPSESLREHVQSSLGGSYVITRELDASVPNTHVFIAADESNDNARRREIVVKVLPRARGTGLDVARFKREIAFAASRLEDQNIVPLFSAGEVDGAPYVTMACVGGESLAVRLARDGTLPIDESIRILRDVARALSHGHAFNILHRDITPSNVLLVRDTAMLADFGVARALQLAVGATPDPAVDNRSDIRDFGVLGYELLTGERPLGDAPTLIHKRRIEVPASIVALITRCMAPRADDRPETAGEVVAALNEIISPTDYGIFGQLGLINSSTVEARSDYFKSRGALGLAAIAVLAAVAGFFTWRATRTADGSAAPPPATSIAVLPFGADGDSASQYVADGVTEETAAALDKITGIHVGSRSATAAAMTSFGSDSKKIGERLQVTALLSARVRPSGERLAIVAQLIDPTNGKSMWSKSYVAANAAQLEDSIARGVAKALHVTVATTQPLAVPGTASATARDAFLRGRAALESGNETALRAAVDFFGKALHDDPRYVAAWVGLANAWTILSDDYVAPKEAVPQIRDAVARGLAIDSADASLRFAHGLIAYRYDRDARAAQTLMGAALAANQEVRSATRWYPEILWTNGLRDSATAYLRHAVARDSTSPTTLSDAWSYAHQSGDALRAIEYCGKLKALRAGDWCEAIQQLDIAQSDAAVAQATRAANLPGARDMEVRLQLVSTLVEAQRVDATHLAEATRIVADVDRAAASSSHSYLRADDIALMHGLLGDSTSAMQWFDRALTDGSGGIGALYWRTTRNPVRTDPRLRALATKAGLQAPPAYWP